MRFQLRVKKYCCNVASELGALKNKLDAQMQHYNKRKLRRGNQVADQSEASAGAVLSTNGNEWVPEGVLLESFRGLGGFGGGSGKLSSRMPDMMTLTKMAWEFFQTNALNSLLRKPLDLLWVQRAYDGTPKVLTFDRHQAVAAPTARYWELRAKDRAESQANNGSGTGSGSGNVQAEEGQQRWRAIKYEDHMALNGNRKPMSGTLDCLGVAGTVHYKETGTDRSLRSASGEETRVSTVVSEELPAKMLVMQRGNSSCLHACIEAAAPALREKALAEVAARGTLVVLGDTCDMCKVNTRYKAGRRHRLRKELAKQQQQKILEAVQADFEAERVRSTSSGTMSTDAASNGDRLARILHVWTNCLSHQFQNTLDRCAQAKRMSADMYSIGFVLSQPQYYGRLQHRLRAVLKRLLRVRRIEPSAADVEYAKECLRLCLLRQFRTRARGTTEEYDKEFQALSDFIEEFTSFCNGPWWRSGVVYHFCTGNKCPCGGDEANALTIMIDLFCRLLFDKLPHPASSSKWWAQEWNLCCISLGILCHNVWGEVFHESFRTTLVPPEPEPGTQEDPITAYRRYLAKNVVKSSGLLSDAKFHMDILVLLLVSEPLDRVDKYAQHCDTVGGSIWDLTGHRGRFQVLQEELTDIVRGRTVGAGVVTQHFRGQGGAARHAFLKQVRRTASSASSLAWYRVQRRYLRLPFSMTLRSSPHVTEQAKLDFAAEVFDGCPNCHDEEFTEELMRGVGTAEELVHDPTYQSPFRLLGRVTASTNMALERFLAVCRQCMGRNGRRAPTIDLQTATALIASLVQLYQKSGGLDYRREQTDIDVGPVRTLAKEKKLHVAEQKQKNMGKGANPFTVFMQEQYPLWAEPQRLLGEKKDWASFTPVAATRWAKLSLLDQERYHVEANEKSARLRDEKNSAAESVSLHEARADCVKGMPFGGGNGRWPVTPQNIMDVAVSVRGTAVVTRERQKPGRRSGALDAAHQAALTGVPTAARVRKQPYVPVVEASAGLANCARKLRLEKDMSFVQD